MYFSCFKIELAKIIKFFYTFAKTFFEMKILVLTEHDDACGPMAAAFLGDYGDRVEAVSAGRHPTEALQPLVPLVMRECLIDLMGYKPRDVAGVDTTSFDAVYECPEWECPSDLQGMRELRDRIKNESFLFFRHL